MNKNDILFHLFFLYQTQIEHGFDTLRVISNFLRPIFAVPSVIFLRG